VTKKTLTIPIPTTTFPSKEIVIANYLFNKSEVGQKFLAVSLWMTKWWQACEAGGKDPRDNPKFKKNYERFFEIMKEAEKEYGRILDSVRHYLNV